MKRLLPIILVALLPTCAMAFDLVAGLAETEHQPSDLSKALNHIMSATTPDLYWHKREFMISEYEKAPVNKALAVSIKNQEYWQTTDQDTQALVGERTLEGCQLQFGSPCKLLVVNDELASVGQTSGHDMPLLKYSGGFDLNQLPIVKDEVRKQPDIQNYLTAQRSKAIAINPIGQMFVVSGLATDKDAADMALARCDVAPGRKKSDGPCYLYSLNNDVVIGKRQTFPWTLLQ
jgi:hypothetical protein